MNDTVSPHRTLLLVEPQFVMRRTVVTVAKELGLGKVMEATSYEAALRMLNEIPFDGMLADVVDDLSCFALVQHVREGATSSPAALPIALMAGSCGPGMIAMFKDLSVRRIMVKPFKVRTAVEVLSDISGVPLPA